jgi:hypothetical protein
MENPASNTTTSTLPVYSWVGKPKQRDTFGILSVCLTTMIICVWSAVHLDIPNTRHSSTRRFLTRVFWSLIGLIAPEILLICAITQFIDAYGLKTKATKYLPSRPMAKPGILARGFNYVLRRAKPYGVSARKQALNNSRNSLNIAGDVPPYRADYSIAEVPLRSRPCILCGNGWF